MNAKRKLQNQVKSLQDTNNDSWINDKYFFEHVAKEKEEKAKSGSENESLIFEDFCSDSEPGIGPPKILSKKIKKTKKEKKEKKDKKKKKKKDRKEKKSKKEKKSEESS